MNDSRVRTSSPGIENEKESTGTAGKVGLRLESEEEWSGASAHRDTHEKTLTSFEKKALIESILCEGGAVIEHKSAPPNLKKRSATDQRVCGTPRRGERFERAKSKERVILQPGTGQERSLPLDEK